MQTKKAQNVGVILAGGQASRMHYQDKALLRLGPQRVIDYVIANAKPQVDCLIINANRNLRAYKALGLSVVSDPYGPNAGPLAGILSAMLWAKTHCPAAQYLFCCPADVPWFPKDCSAQLQATLTANDAEVSWLCTDQQWQPLFSLWSMRLLPQLQEALARNLYSPMLLIRSLNNAMHRIDNAPEGYFANLNTPADLERAALIAAKR